MLGESLHVRHQGRKIVITAFEARRGRAMKKFRGNGDVTFASDSLSDIANVGVDAEGFLEDEHSGKRTFSFGTSDECLHRTAVGNCHRVFFGSVHLALFILSVVLAHLFVGHHSLGQIS